MKKIVLALALVMVVTLPTTIARAQISRASERDAINVRLSKAYIVLRNMIASTPAQQYIHSCGNAWRGMAVQPDEMCSDREAHIVKRIYEVELKKCRDFGERIALAAERPWAQATSERLNEDNLTLTTCESWARKVQVYGPRYRFSTK